MLQHELKRVQKVPNCNKSGQEKSGSIWRKALSQKFEGTNEAQANGEESIAVASAKLIKTYHTISYH
jgi:hypothetical protein